MNGTGDDDEIKQQSNNVPPMVDLFGGAITTIIPSSWRDVSQVRQVPDNQEVYQDCNEETGAVLVVEILEYQSNVENGNTAIDFFLNDLGDANGATERRSKALWTLDLFEDDSDDKKLVFVPNLQLCCPPLQREKDRAYLNIGRGSQRVARKGSTNADWVDIEICILRFKDIKTDLLITLSMPHIEKKVDGGMARGMWTEEYSSEFKQILEHFNIKDWSLFGY